MSGPDERTAALDVAERFHEAYERLAPGFGYETRPETRTFDPLSNNGMLMIAVCDEVLCRQPAPARAGGGWREAMTREQVIARFCKLQSEVTQRLIGYRTPNDCFCLNPAEGGLSPNFADEGLWCSEGKSLEWIERVVLAELDRIDKAVGRDDKDGKP